MSSRDARADDVLVIDAARTPIGKFLGAYGKKTGVDLGVLALTGLLARTKIDPSKIEAVILGNARGAGLGPNPGRQVAVRSLVPFERPAYTVNQACASGLRAIVLGAEQIRLGEADLVACGGAESMSNVPFLLPRYRE